MRKFGFVALTLALTAIVAGCASTYTTDASWPSASPPSVSSPVLTSPNTDAPLAGHSDAAGSASVPGYYSVPPDLIIIAPETTR